MRLITTTALVLTLLGGVAAADRGREVVRDNRTVVHEGNKTVVHDNRTVVREPSRRNFDNRTVVHDRTTTVYNHPRYTGTVRSDRRVIERRPLYVNGGRFTFHDGRSIVYTRPVIREHYHNFRVRPELIVENYPAQNGYIWVRGGWSWNGGEWIWAGGHYAPDTSIRVYYSDGSWD